ncbi:hypothetical protein V865_006249 [Kwoniella europaea PYCC6329]|uniref:Uncharacterized protein n=1 Tax=Kwoniella europaea PYCC6329 TaxID=1423913 RepID=A0AAX4KS90_9TREE
MIPEYTRVVNVVGDESQNYWGPGPLQDSWTKEELENKSAAKGPYGTLYTQALNLTSPTVITPYGDWTWDTLKGKAHFYCPEGKCVNDECLGVPVPTWIETLYDAQHGNETTGRNGDNIRS